MRVATLLISAVAAMTSVDAAEPSFPDSLRLMDGSGYLHPQSLSGAPSILLFWDDSCAPCRLEIDGIEALRTAAPDVQFVVVALIDDKLAREHLAPAIEAGAFLTLAPRDPRPMLRRFGNARGALPFSVMFRPDGSLCKSHLGQLQDATVANLRASCGA